jgi:hypothetical protein
MKATTRPIYLGRSKDRLPRVGLSFGTCRNRQGRSASARHRNDLARRYSPIALAMRDLGEITKLSFWGRGVKMCRSGGV